MEIKRLTQIEKRMKAYCREINSMNIEFIKSDDELERNYLTRQISMYLSMLLELKWVSGVNYYKFIK